MKSFNQQEIQKQLDISLEQPKEENDAPNAILYKILLFCYIYYNLKIGVFTQTIIA